MSQPKHYDLGDLVRAVAIFKDADNVLTDPSAVRFKVKDPAGAIVTYVYGTDAQLVRDSAGNYHVDIDADAAGFWYYRFYSTGSGQAAAEGVFGVNRSNFS